MSLRREIEEKIENYAKRLESFNNDNDGNNSYSYILLLQPIITYR